ncbi:DUF1064 domain-containing protein [Paraclostridium tenue]|nr:DUF1064 domain-containing protein [[Eubacterium] tenue]
MSKYKNKKVEIDGIKFDSKDESQYYLYLKKQKEDGKIKDFGLQQKFELQPSFKKDGKTYRAITYTVDFAVYKWNGEVEYIDVKGMETQQGLLRKKLFDYKYPDLKLTWVAKNLKYGVDGWIEYSELKKKRKAAKKVS